jgi:hypothetical protein
VHRRTPADAAKRKSAAQRADRDQARREDSSITRVCKRRSRFAFDMRVTTSGPLNMVCSAGNLNTARLNRSKPAGYRNRQLAPAAYSGNPGSVTPVPIQAVECAPGFSRCLHQWLLSPPTAPVESPHLNASLGVGRRPEPAERQEMAPYTHTAFGGKDERRRRTITTRTTKDTTTKNPTKVTPNWRWSQRGGSNAGRAAAQRRR